MRRAIVLSALLLVVPSLARADDANGTRAHATRLSPNTVLTDGLDPAGGDLVDWHFVDLGEVGLAKLECDWEPRDAAILVDVLTSDDQPIAGLEPLPDGSERALLVPIAHAGRYFLRVTAPPDEKRVLRYHLTLWAPGNRHAFARWASNEVPFQILKSYRDASGDLVMLLNAGTRDGIEVGDRGHCRAGVDLERTVVITRVLDDEHSIARMPYANLRPYFERHPDPSRPALRCTIEVP